MPQLSYHFTTGLTNCSLVYNERQSSRGIRDDNESKKLEKREKCFERRDESEERVGERFIKVNTEAYV